MNLPFQIYYNILNKISDNKTYLNCRLVCKDWHQFLNVIKEFNNNKLIAKTYFHSNKIIKYDNNGNMINHCIFGPLGYYKYTSYHPSLPPNIIESNPPFKIRSTETTNKYIKEKTYDIREDKVNTKMSFIPSCNIM